MKRMLLGILVGLFLGWVTVPLVRAAWVKTTSDFTGDDEEYLKSHAYKWYLTQMLAGMKELNGHLAQIEQNTFAVRKKLNA